MWHGSGFGAQHTWDDMRFCHTAPGQMWERDCGSRAAALLWTLGQAYVVAAAGQLRHMAFSELGTVLPFAGSLEPLTV